MAKFYDTSSLLLLGEKVFENDEKFLISSITLKELEDIKVSANKDPEIKYEARRLLRAFDINPDKYEIIIYTDVFAKRIQQYHLELTNDTKILACAAETFDAKEFVTNDLALKHIAKIFFGDAVSSVKEDSDDKYCGYKEIYCDDMTLAELYSNFKENKFNLNINEYALIYNEDKDLVDQICWTGTEYRHITFTTFNSKWFGKVKPFKGDKYQQLAADSLVNNKITMLKGPAGSGKTYLALGYLLSELDKGKLDKIIVFCNTVATRNSARLGFYPGTRDEKLLDSQIGNLLSSKLGGKIEVERMIEEEKLILLPLSDIRGYDTTGMRAGIYISEAQNLDISLMKLALQRIGDDSICIIDGDEKTQVDDIAFAGSNNGMRRASKVFRNTDIYGEVELRNIHRSKIAKIAEKM